MRGGGLVSARGVSCPSVSSPSSEESLFVGCSLVPAMTSRPCPEAPVPRPGVAEVSARTRARLVPGPRLARLARLARAALGKRVRRNRAGMRELRRARQALPLARRALPLARRARPLEGAEPEGLVVPAQEEAVVEPRARLVNPGRLGQAGPEASVARQLEARLALIPDCRSAPRRWPQPPSRHPWWCRRLVSPASKSTKLQGYRRASP
jgi:hypothetical protein